MKRILKISMPFLIILILLLAAYCSGVYYFGSRFNPNVWINGVYCTGKTLDEINSELVARTQLPKEFVINGYTDCLEETAGSESISLEDVSFAVDYSVELKRVKDIESPRKWIVSFNRSGNYTIYPNYTFDEQALADSIKTLKIYTQEANPLDFYIKYVGEKQGYTYYDGTKNRLNQEEALKSVSQKLAVGEYSADWIREELYKDAELTANQKKAQDLWNELQVYATKGPFYDFEEDGFQIANYDMLGFLKKGSDNLPVKDTTGHFVLKTEAIEAYVDSMADEYDTYDKKWEFSSTSGGLVPVQGVTYGGTIDRDLEKQWLTEYMTKIVNGEAVTEEERVRIPEYTRKPYYRGKTSVGSTYIEVDMGEQKLYYYEKGKLQLETEIVTGNMKRKMNTPEGVNFVYGKARNRILRGPNYATFVKYWMPVKGNIGIHDASWRKEFGGDIYETNGSHGCINLPTDKAGELFEQVEMGTPVIMFY